MNQASEVACCAVCNQQTHRRCGRCLDIYYCNTDHQRDDWRRHKRECLPKLTSPEANEKITECSTKVDVLTKTNQIPSQIEESARKDVPKVEGVVDTRRSKKNKKKKSKKGGSDNPNSDKQSSEVSEQSVSAEPSKESSVISSVVHAYRDSNVNNAITYEGSSEQEILSESAQLLNTLEFGTAGPSNVLRTVNRTDVKMPALPNTPEAVRKEYPEASLKGTEAPFSNLPNSYFMDSSDQLYEICQRVIRDMTQYGVCVLDNFLGKDKGLLVLNEVLTMYRSGIFQAGQLVSTPTSQDTATVRSDRITWIDGKEPHCLYIGQLISQVDNIVLRANKMINNGKMGDYIINGRTKAMVACYPGSGSHYVKHVDNPNKDGRCITAIYYLNRDWDLRRCGGLLRVFPEGTNQVADIAPFFDRMLFFWSDRRNPHEVQPAYSTRYAITLWYFDAQERAEARRHFVERGQPSSSK